MATYNVLDVSKFNTVSDYDKAFKEIDGVIIRCGYRGYGVSGTMTVDNLFNTHINGFKDKTKIGVYWFTQAISEAEAIEEANYAYNIFKKYNIDFPVYIDSEYANNSHSGRADKLNKSTRTSIIITFCDRIKELGYKAGVYASESWFLSNLDLKQLQDKKYSIWVAKYSENKPSFDGYDGWQYTSSGTIRGINENIDLSIFYNDVAGWETIPDAININTIKATLEYESTEYSGYAKFPSLYYEGLRIGIDYDLQYTDNINVGEAKIIATGIPPLYTGTNYFTFKILPKDINDLSIYLSEKEYTYDNTKKEPEISIPYLTEDTDYTVEYKDNINAGTATVTIIGKGNYTGTKKLSFKINPLSIDIMPCYIEKYNYRYTGEPIAPDVVLSELEFGVDYEVEYKDNIEIGTATIIVTAKGNYSGSKTLSFTISKNDIRDFGITIDEKIIYIYDGLEKEPIVYIDEPIILDKDYTVKYQDNINAGTARIIVTGIGDYFGTVEIEFKIERKSIGKYKINLSQKEYNFDNTSIEPKFEIEGLIEKVDYEIIYSNNRFPGIAKITVNGINNYIGSINTNFKINHTKISSCVAKYGQPSIKTIYRIDDNTFILYANKEQYKLGNRLTQDIDYVINSIEKTQMIEYILVKISVKGLNGLSGNTDFYFRVIDKEPDLPIDYSDDGVYNFGYIDENDETVSGMYDFGDSNEGVDSENIASGDYDFDKLSGLYMDHFDTDDGTNINPDGSDKENHEEKYKDDGIYNFGDIDYNDMTANGDYDFGDLDEGIDPDTAVIDGKDYDFNILWHDGELWIDAGTIFELSSTNIYAAHHAKASSFEYTGKVFVYNSTIVNGRIRLCRIEDAVESPARILGWAIVQDLLDLDQIVVGEPVIVTGKIYQNSDGSGSYIEKDRDTMYVSEVVDKADYPYGLSTLEKGSIIGYANKDSIIRAEDY